MNGTKAQISGAQHAIRMERVTIGGNQFLWLRLSRKRAKCLRWRANRKSGECKRKASGKLAESKRKASGKSVESERKSSGCTVPNECAAHVSSTLPDSALPHRSRVCSI